MVILRNLDCLSSDTVPLKMLLTFCAYCSEHFAHNLRYVQNMCSTKYAKYVKNKSVQNVAFCTHAKQVHAAYEHCGYNHAICAYVTGSGKRDNFTQYFEIYLLALHQPGPAE